MEGIQEQELVTPVSPAPGPAGQKSLGEMNWTELNNYFIGKGKVNRAAIFDRKGKNLACSPGLQIPEDEVITIIRCLDSICKGLDRPHFALFFGDARFLCFRPTTRTMIGRTRADFFVAHLCDDVIIFAFSPLLQESNISCIGEVWTFAREVQSRMEISAFIG